MVNEEDIIVIDNCPACGGRHAISGHDQGDFVCTGSFEKPKKKWNNMTGSALTSDEGAMSRFNTKVDERRDTTIVGYTPSKEKGRMYKDSDYN